MELGPWIALATVLAVPLLVASDSGRNWLAHRARSERVWVVIVTAAVLGVLFAFGVFRHSVGMGAAVLVATPLIQGIMFVAVDRAFQLWRDAFQCHSIKPATDGVRMEGAAGQMQFSGSQFGWDSSLVGCFSVHRSTSSSHPTHEDIVDIHGRLRDRDRYNVRGSICNGGD